MKRLDIPIGLIIFVLISLWNSRLLTAWMNPTLPSNGAWQSPADSGTAEIPEPQLWRDIKDTSFEEESGGELIPEFHESVLAADGRRVELPGVGMLLKSGVRENDRGEDEVTEFLLLPGNEGVAWCCGLTPIPRRQFSVLVECNDAPFPASKADPKNSVVFVSVTGIFRLQKENYIKSFFTLEDAEIEFVDIKNIVPPNVMNMCRNEPMFR
ncbi:MAG: hypothetical protein AAF532_15905 [Planctomycetota bacterium]